ncbi:MAG: hypothetical protein WD669_08730 [Pirellulales bacterium]
MSDRRLRRVREGKERFPFRGWTASALLSLLMQIPVSRPFYGGR